MMVATEVSWIETYCLNRAHRKSQMFGPSPDIRPASLCEIGTRPAGQSPDSGESLAFSTLAFGPPIDMQAIGVLEPITGAFLEGHWCRRLKSRWRSTSITTP